MIRPKIITLLCVIGFITVVLGFPQVFSPQIKKLGVFMPAIYGILVSLYFIACVGIWHFKQWGAELFVITFFFKIIFFLYVGLLDSGFYFSSIIAATSIIILLKHYGKMNKNL